jgi:hypothetical protein
MANIPGISGYVQPGVFARDRVISRGVTIPGGLRIPCIMGEGLREETIVESAVGSGQDGDASCSPTGEPAGRFFKLRYSPVISGRTELYVNGSALRGTESQIDESSFSGDFDFRIDIETGCIELQGASIADQDGKKWSASSLNKGDGTIPDEVCGDISTIQILDKNAPQETWTVKAVGVVRDGNNEPINGLTTFTVSGSVSGQIKDSAGRPIVFQDSYFHGTQGATSGNKVPCDDGYVIASSSTFGLGTPVADGGETPENTSQFSVPTNLLSAGQVLVGDYLCVDDGYGSFGKITSMAFASGSTTITIDTDVISTAAGPGFDWEIKATNLFIDQSTSVEPTFTSSSVGKVLAICGGGASGLYKIIKVTNSKRVRVESLSDSTIAYPTLEGVGGLSSSGQDFYILETNGILLFGIKPGATRKFAVGDKFFINVKSRVLNKNDRLEARYIAVSDINDPELFLSAAELFQKHGRESVSNTLSLGSRLCFENQGPYVLALQCKPPIPRRTTVTLVDEKNSKGVGGVQVCNGDPDACEVDDLTFIIPQPTSGLQRGRPDTDTQVNIFVIRNGQEIQILPNKYGPFYNGSLDLEEFTKSENYAYSYTVVETGNTILGQGNLGAITEDIFTSLEINFDAEDVGKIIVVQSLKNSSGDIISQAPSSTGYTGISETLFGSSYDDGSLVELTIVSIKDDNSVVVEGNDSGGVPLVSGVDVSEINFYIKDPSDTSSVRAALVLNKSIIGDSTSTATLRKGDGLKISYIDEVDADFFDTNWFEAFEALEAEECQIVVPLPAQNRSVIFRAAVQHVETMSTIAIQKERIAMFGAQQGVTVAALLGQEEVAVEDIGILEGIQGDDPEEVLDGNIEDIQNFKLSDNYTSNRSVYFYPDQIVRAINGTNTLIDGFYMAAAAAGYLSATQNVAIPLTNKVLSGFNILRDKKYRPVVLNQLGAVGATVVQPVVGGGKVLAGRTTSQSGYVEDEEISIIFIRDRVKEVLRQGLQPFIGVVEDNNTLGSITSRVIGLLSSLVTQGLITGYKNVRVERDKLDPRQWNVYLQFQPAYPINYIFIDIEVGVA